MIKECQLQSNQGEDFKTGYSFFECWQRQISFLLLPTIDHSKLIKIRKNGGRKY